VTEENSMNTAADRAARIVTAGIVAVALGTMGAVGCGPRAAALPAGFPDFGSFAAAPVDNYIGTGPKGPKRFVTFSTPYNISCNFIATIDPVPAGSSQGTICEGEIPGVASGPPACAEGKVGDAGATGFRFEREPSSCPIGTFNDGTLLNAGQKVSYQNVTCAVGGDGLVACLDTSLGQHGFVVKPSGNAAF
jgi:hypothetical protein